MGGPVFLQLRMQQPLLLRLKSLLLRLKSLLLHLKSPLRLLRPPITFTNKCHTLHLCLVDIRA